MRTAHEKNIKKKTKCNNCGGPNCGQRLSGLSILEKISHMMDCYRRQQEEKNGCVFCPELNFSSEPNLLNHISIVHGGEGPMSGPMSGPSCIGTMNVPVCNGPTSGPGWNGLMSV